LHLHLLSCVIVYFLEVLLRKFVRIVIIHNLNLHIIHHHPYLLSLHNLPHIPPINLAFGGHNPYFILGVPDIHIILGFLDMDPFFLLRIVVELLQNSCEK